MISVPSETRFQSRQGPRNIARDFMYWAQAMQHRKLRRSAGRHAPPSNRPHPLAQNQPPVFVRPRRQRRDLGRGRTAESGSHSVRHQPSHQVQVSGPWTIRDQREPPARGTLNIEDIPEAMPDGLGRHAYAFTLDPAYQIRNLLFAGVPAISRQTSLLQR